ncbi:MAG TPA: sugar ABC transporter permease [Devosiaceae bacterium]|jgi:multiple sugar transport system permease protein
MADQATISAPATPAPARRGNTRSGPVGNTRLLAYGLLLPALLCVAFLLGYPLYLVFQLSLSERAGMNFLQVGTQHWGLANFQIILSDGRTWFAIWRSVAYTIGSIVPSFLIGLGVALLFNNVFPGRRWLRSLVLLPWAVPGVVVSIIFLWMFDTSFGVINSILRDLHIISGEVPWFTSPNVALISVIIPTIWKGFPFFALTLLAALQSIPASLYEAAKVDGATRWERFRHVTWPGIRGAAALVTILQTLWVLREFDIIYATTGGGPIGSTETLGLLVYNEAFKSFRMGTASAIGVLMLVIALVLIVLSLKPLKREYF